MRRPQPRTAAAAITALLAGLALAGCTSGAAEDTPAGDTGSAEGTGGTASAPGPAASGQPGEDGQPGSRGGVRRERYVALGDSYTAGPFVPVTDVAGGCFRSDGNYPSLVAERLDLELVDVSCGGATTEDLTRRQPTIQDGVVPPQVRALDADTDLVTLGIGGNDFELFTSLIGTCLGSRADDPAGAPCQAALRATGTDPAEVTRRIGANVETALGEVAARAPEARVVLVGYPRIAPTSGGCPQRLPFAAGDVGFGDQVVRSLNRALQGAARAAEVEFLDVYAASRGHDVCSDDPWVNGQQTDTARAAAFHPFPEGMAGVARALEDLLAG
jgi:lysophospholipase L1-like esterase